MFLEPVPPSSFYRADQAEEAKKKDAKKKEGTKEISLLDVKRAMNTSIAIARIRMTHAETRQAIMGMDETALPSNVVQLLQVPACRIGHAREHVLPCWFYR